MHASWRIAVCLLGGPVFDPMPRNPPDRSDALRNLGLRTRITAALALASAATAVFVLLGAMWIIVGIIDRADERELRSHYDALQSRPTQESRRAAAMSAVVAAM